MGENGKGYCYTHRQPADHQRLVEIVRRFCPLPAYLLQMRLDDLALRELDADWPDRAAADPTMVWAEGRAFGTRCEVRWLQTDDAYQVMLLTEQPPKDGLGEEWAEPVTYQVSEQPIFLWGEWDEEDETYWQTNIPRSFRWPVPAQQRARYAALKTVEYRKGGMTRLTRLRGVVAINQEGKEVAE